MVYGDIGTSPLYAFREAVTSAQHSGLDGNASVLGVLSLILWALMLIVTGKYVTLLLRAFACRLGVVVGLLLLGSVVTAWPLGESDCTVQLEIFEGVEMALLIEMIVYGMNELPRISEEFASAETAALLVLVG